MSYDIVLKRVYQPIESDDGARLLVDRLWPRGKRRESLALTDWYRDASPSLTLRRQYHEGEISAGVFASRYRASYATPREPVATDAIRTQQTPDPAFGSARSRRLSPADTQGGRAHRLAGRGRSRQRTCLAALFRT